MENTVHLLQKLGVPALYQDFLKGTIEIPYVSDGYKPFSENWYPHPPFLVPVFADKDLPAVSGIIVHPFSDREHSYVTYNLDVDYVLEKARTIQQLLAYMVLEMDMIAEGLDDRIRSFCRQVGFNDAEEVDAYCDEHGNITTEIRHLAPFGRKTPLSYCKSADEYDGDFPTSDTLLIVKNLPRSCSFEIADKKKLQASGDVPVWLHPDSNPKELFREFIAQKDLEKAWLALNGKGWRCSEIAASLLVLKKQSENEIFGLLADSWISGWEAAGAKEYTI